MSLLAETNRLDIGWYGRLGVVFFKNEYVAVGGRVVDARNAVEIGFEYIPEAEAVRTRMRELGAGHGDAISPLTWGRDV